MSISESSAAARVDDALVGEIIGGRYQVQKLLGKGGMGKVFKVQHVELGKVFAMKVLHRDLTNDPQTVERFKREARSASRIGCQNIVEITDFAFDDKVGHFFVMEYLEGMDLHHRIKNFGPMHYTQACHILLQVCDALAAVHREGIIHRDLKPDNIILIDRDRRIDIAKILDFGIAAMQTQFEEGSERLTQAGMIFGTPAYMSPEQAWGTEKLDNRTDIYSLGCIAYEMVTGYVPFKGDHPFQIIDMHVHVPPTPPGQVRPDLQIPPEMESVVLGCMAKRREERFQNAEQLQQAILSFFQPNVTPVVDHRTGEYQPSSEQLVAASGMLARPRLSVDGMVVSGPTALAMPSRKWTYLLIGGVVLLSAVIAAIVILLLQKPSSDGHAATAVLAASAKNEAATKAQGEADRKRLEAELTQKLEKQLATKFEKQQGATVTVNFSSDPAGASVYRGDQFLGFTPLSFKFERSDSDVVFKFTKDGFNPSEQKVVPNREGVVVAAKLESLTPTADNTGRKTTPGVHKSSGNGKDPGERKTGPKEGPKSSTGGTGKPNFSDDFK